MRAERRRETLPGGGALETGGDAEATEGVGSGVFSEEPAPIAVLNLGRTYRMPIRGAFLLAFLER